MPFTGCGSASRRGSPTYVWCERRTADNGSTLVEVLVSISLISVVMAALAAFFISTNAVIRVQGERQTAVQLATEAMERARKLEPASLVSGRDQQSVNTQWATPIVSVDLSDTQEVYDAAAADGAGASATLPTTSQTVTVDGVDYTKYWYLGKCGQPKAGGNCSTSSSYAAMYRLVVAVVWSDSVCSGNCVYVVSTLVSSKYPDPLFNVSDP